MLKNLLQHQKYWGHVLLNLLAEVFQSTIYLLRTLFVNIVTRIRYTHQRIPVLPNCNRKSSEEKPYILGNMVVIYQGPYSTQWVNSLSKYYNYWYSDCINQEREIFWNITALINWVKFSLIYLYVRGKWKFLLQLSHLIHTTITFVIQSFYLYSNITINMEKTSNRNVNRFCSLWFLIF